MEDVRWQKVDRLFAREGDLVSWFSSVQLLFIGLVAYLTYMVTRLKDRHHNSPTPYRWLWFLLAGGFLLFSCDEYFMFHEQFTDALEDRNVLTEVPRLHPGDVGILLYLAIGWSMLYGLWQILRSNHLSIALVVGGMGIITLVGISDAFTIDAIGSDHKILYSLRVILEELGESFTKLCFALAFLQVFFDRLAELVQLQQEANPTPETPLASVTMRLSPYAPPQLQTRQAVRLPGVKRQPPQW